MTKLDVLPHPNMHVHELTFSAGTTITFASKFRVTKACLVTGAKATATANLYTWSRSGDTVTITSSASTSETVSVLEIGGMKT